MSKQLRQKLAAEINTNWARKKGVSASRGGEYFNQGEIRVVKSQFDRKLQNILNNKFEKAGAQLVTPVPVVNTDFSKLRKHLYDHIKKESTKNVMWKLGTAHRSKGNANLIAITYVRGTTKKGEPRKGNLEQTFQLVVKEGIKSFMEEQGSEITNLEYEHGKTRESQFKQAGPESDLFTKKDAFGGAQGTNAEQVSFMEVDKFLRGDAASKITKDKRLLGSVDKTITYGLEKLFGINTSLSQYRRENGLKDTLLMQGEIVPVEDRDNPGTVDTEIKKQINRLLTDQATFIKMAVESGAKKSTKTALDLFSDSPNPVEALDPLSKKQIIDKMFTHATSPDLRFKVNKRLIAEGKKARSTRKSKTKSGVKKTNYKRKVTAAAGGMSGGVRGTQTMRTQQNPMAIRNLLNELLPQVIAQNMVAPALRYRTGRFANSVQVDNITQGPRGGNTMIETSYRNDPYETFAPGGKKYTSQRDPERLIKRSVREIATGLIGARFGIEVN